MALNRRGAGEFSVDIFSVTESIAADGTAGARLEERTSVRSSQFSSPNDLVAAGRDSFFLSNGKDEGASFAGVLGSYLTLPGANIVYYDGQVPRVVADGLRYADGLALSQDGRMLYVTQRVGRNIRTYDVQQSSGALQFSGNYPLPAGLDHIDADAQGRLWVAGEPKLFAYDRYAHDKTAPPPPTQIFRVSTTSGIPAGVTPVYTGLGKRIGAASAAAFAGGHLLIGSRYDNKVLVCTPR
jgi:arylesterase/paraoxonase